MKLDEEELRDTDPCDYFINKIALVDPVEGEIVVTYERVMLACAKFELDELHLLYERLRHCKVARLREAHGTDIISIVDIEGAPQYSECGRNKSKPPRPPVERTREEPSLNAEARSVGLQ